MPTLIGNAAKPNGAGGWEAWSGTYNMVAELLSMPERGRIVSVGIWAAGNNQTATATVCCWDAATGALLGESDDFVMGGMAPASGNVQLHVYDLLVPVELELGDDFLVGLWRDKDRSHQLTGRSTGAHLDERKTTAAGGMADADSGGHGFGDYSVGAHAYYEPTSGAWVRRGAATVRADSVQVHRAGAFADAERVQVYRGGSWVDAD